MIHMSSDEVALRYFHTEATENRMLLENDLQKIKVRCVRGQWKA